MTRVEPRVALTVSQAQDNIIIITAVHAHSLPQSQLYQWGCGVQGTVNSLKSTETSRAIETKGEVSKQIHLSFCHNKKCPPEGKERVWSQKLYLMQKGQYISLNTNLYFII